MSGRRHSSTPISETFDRFLTDKGKGDGGETGNYRRNAETQLERFAEWCRGDIEDEVNAGAAGSWDGIGTGDTVTFNDLNATVFSDYIRYLKSRGLASSTINTYYSYVSSWSEWAAREGYVDVHYARRSEATSGLEEPDQKPGSQQAWEPAHRDSLTRHVDERAEEALDTYAEFEIDSDERHNAESQAWRLRQKARYEAVKSFRDRALVYFLSYTGLRGAEILSAESDSRPGRNGLRWKDVDFESNSLTVFRKTQQWKEASLPDPVAGPLNRYQSLLDPPETWPVFPTLHIPTLSKTVQTALTDAGYSSVEIEDLRAEKPDLLILADEGCGEPNPLSTDGARRVLKRLTSEAGIELDGKHNYLAPHGARRGMGEVLVREFGFAEAARYLDNSEEQIREAYQHIEAGERAQMATEALSRTDQRVRSPLADETDQSES